VYSRSYIVVWKAKTTHVYVYIDGGILSWYLQLPPVGGGNPAQSALIGRSYTWVLVSGVAGNPAKPLLFRNRSYKRAGTRSQKPLFVAGGVEKSSQLNSFSLACCEHDSASHPPRTAKQPDTNTRRHQKPTPIRTDADGQTPRRCVCDGMNHSSESCHPLWKV